MQKGFIYIGIILLIVSVVAVSAGAYWLGTKGGLPTTISPSSTLLPAPASLDETANWQTYKNDGLGYGVKEWRGFEFKYPEYFKKNFEENRIREYFTVSGERPEWLSMEFNLRPFDGFEYENQAGAFSFRYDARSQTWQPSQIGVSQNLAPKKKITESGLIYYYIETGDGPTVSDQAFIPHPSENMIVKIELARNESYRDCITPCPEAKPFSDDQTIEQILSTFKFIQKEQKSENSTLSTYQNETVTFKFPVEWIQKPILVRGSGFTQEFEDPTAKFHLTFSTSGNYSQVTGKPYANNR